MLLSTADDGRAYSRHKEDHSIIFIDPYRDAEQNRWTSPWLDATAARFRDDIDLYPTSAPWRSSPGR